MGKTTISEQNESILTKSMGYSINKIVEEVAKGVQSEILNCNNASFEQKFEMIHILRKRLDDLLNSDVKKSIEEECEYCPQCNSYYRRKVFETIHEMEHRTVCTFRNFAEFGDNEYEDKDCDVAYKICPKGHKIEVNCVW